MLTDQSFIAVTAEDNIAEKGFSCFSVEGAAVAICRFKNEYFALENSCSHALSTFDGGRLRGYRIICPLHGATFDIRDGSATGAPAKRPIRTFPLRIVDGMIEVDISDDPAPVETVADV
jgi:3-phenylpropionate/trans-cinnamate dioxygenase ferredoxin subunit